ncbi:acyltransferase family protein [Geodermatophilus sp. SYSU D01186]
MNHTRSDVGAPSAARGEIRALTGLRIVAALWVVALHLSYAPVPTFTGLLAPLQPLVSAGWLGVDLFFMLSGFVITLTYLHKMGERPTLARTRDFLWARIARLWPLYALVTVVFWAWLLLRSTVDDNPSFQMVQPQLGPAHLVEQLLMVQQWHRPYFPGASYVGPGWSVSAEWLAYLAFPLVAWGLWRIRRGSPVVLLAGAVVLASPLGIHTLMTGTAGFPYQWAVRIAGGFLAGALTCLAVRQIQATEARARLASRVAIGAVVLVLAVVYAADVLARRWGGDYQGLAIAAFPVLIAAISLAGGRLTAVLGSRPLVHGGRISFAVYLVHDCLFEIVWTGMLSLPWLAPETTKAHFLNAVCIPLVLLLAHVLYTRVEEPLRCRLRAVQPWPARSVSIVAREAVPATVGGRS